MHKSLVAAAATAAVLAIGGPANKAAAMLVVTPNELGLAGGAATVERTVLVCDAWRCYWRPGYWGWYRPYPTNDFNWLPRHYWYAPGFTPAGPWYFNPDHTGILGPLAR